MKTKLIMTRFLRLLMMLLLASMQLTAVADENEKYEVMEINGVWYKVHYYYCYHECQDHANGYYRYEPDSHASVTCPPDGYQTYCGDINIIDKLELNVDGDPFTVNVDVIEENAFKNSDITSVYISPMIYRIRESAFEGCHNLRKVEFGGFDDMVLMGAARHLEFIHSYAFKDCTSLENITVPYIIRSDELYGGNSRNVFEGCTSLETVNFEEGISSIGAYWFYNCTKLYSVMMPSSVTIINTFAFANCNSLQIVNISKNLTHIYASAFLMCNLLNCVTYEGVRGDLAKKYSMVLPEGLKSLGQQAFASCHMLRAIYLPASLEEINRYFNVFSSLSTFCDCNWLDVIDVDKNNPYYTSVDNVLYSKDMNTIYQFAGSTVTSFTIPKSVNAIEKNAFYGFKNLKDVKFNEELTRINQGSFYKTGLQNVTIPSSVKNIESSAFGYCGSLESVQFNEGLETIGSSAFYDCPLNNLVIPASVTKIENGAFKKTSIDCTPLTVINYSETPLPITSNSSLIFNEEPDLQKMYVPKGCKAAYENAEGLYAHWAKSFTIYEMDELDGIEKTTNDRLKYSIAGDFLSIDNADNGTAVSIYGIDGRLIASDIVKHGAANINISKHKGMVAILRIGNKKHKVVL